jgi:hypothetical protein
MRYYTLILMFFVAIAMTSCGSGTTTKETNVSDTVAVEGVDSLSTEELTVEGAGVEADSSVKVQPIQ